MHNINSNDIKNISLIDKLHCKSSQPSLPNT